MPAHMFRRLKVFGVAQGKKSEFFWGIKTARFPSFTSGHHPAASDELRSKIVRPKNQDLVDTKKSALSTSIRKIEMRHQFTSLFVTATLEGYCK
jgi:hypothetical protein